MPRDSQSGRRAGGAARLRGAAKEPGWVLLIIFIIVAAVLVGRLCYLQIFKSGEYSAAAREQRTSNLTLSAARGTIYDRNGTVLATTVEVTTVYANPSEVTDAQGEAEQIAATLGGSSSDYIDELTQSDASFVYVYRKADKDAAARLQALELPGIYFLEDNKRVYPYEGVGNQVIGATDVDGKGVSGLELEYDQQLTGTDGVLCMQRGLTGTPISGGLIVESEAEDGDDVIVSLDIEMQQYIEQTLTKAVSDYNAEGGSITIYDGATGEIYATASSPVLDAGDSWRESSADAFNLKTVSDVYEPGSTMKAITTAAVLNENAATLDTRFDIPAQLDVDEYVVTDAEEHGELNYSLSEVLQQSSNIGMILASRLIPRQKLFGYYELFGFGQDCGIDFPGATEGYLSDYTQWSEAAAANIPFGQGVSVSAIQLVRAYGAFTNKGVMCTPHFLLNMTGQDAEGNDWTTTRVITEKTATTMQTALESVVTDGTAKGAVVVPGYSVAGKTGTAEKADGNGTYLKDQYIVSFCGYLAGTDSQLICLVTLDNPAGYDGAAPACFVFSDVMAHVADAYKINPGT